MSQHATLSPSSAHRWLKCTASVEADSKYADRSSPAAVQGTAAHELGEEMLTRTLMEKDTNIKTEDFLGVNIHEDVIVDQEMVDNIDRYVDEINDSLEEGDIFGIEMRVPIGHITGEKDGQGTADFIRVSKDLLTLGVHDLKYGKGVKVFSEGNEQMMMYALGALKEYEWLLTDEYNDYYIQSIALHIHQPRLDHHDVFVIDTEDLLAFEFDVITACNKINTGKVEFSPGTKVCRWCSHRPFCEAASGKILQMVEDEFPLLDEPELQHDVVHLAEMVPQISFIRDWCAAVEAAAYTKLEAGTDVPGYKLVAGRKSRVYVDAEEALAFARKKFKLKLDDVAPRKFITAPQMEKQLGKAKYKTFAETHVKFVPGKKAMAPNSDKRPAITSVEALGFEDLDKPTTEGG